MSRELWWWDYDTHAPKAGVESLELGYGGDLKRVHVDFNRPEDRQFGRHGTFPPVLGETVLMHDGEANTCLGQVLWIDRGLVGLREIPSSFAPGTIVQLSAPWPLGKDESR